MQSKKSIAAFITVKSNKNLFSEELSEGRKPFTTVEHLQLRLDVLFCLTQQWNFLEDAQTSKRLFLHRDKYCHHFQKIRSCQEFEQQLQEIHSYRISFFSLKSNIKIKRGYKHLAYSIFALLLLDLCLKKLYCLHIADSYVLMHVCGETCQNVFKKHQ